MSKIYILLSFDYELPLGGVNGTYNDSLFSPTNQLLNLADKFKVPLNFFADVLSVKRFDELGIKGYSEDFKSQLNDAFQKGHDIQLHLHPHWLDTDIVDGVFHTSEKYSLGDVVDQIDDVVKNGIQILKNITQDSKYQPVAFRAGGYVLNPNTEEILKSLQKAGIKIDSSICKGYFFKSNLSTVDYTNVPKKANWRLDHEGDFSRESTDGLYEIPIVGKSKGFFEVPTFFKMKKYAHRMAKASGKMIHAAPAILSPTEKIKKILCSRMLTFDNYTYDLDYNNKILSTYLDKIDTTNDVYLSAIGHPKTMGNYGMKLFEKFVNDTKTKLGERVEFITYQQASEKLKL